MKRDVKQKKKLKLTIYCSFIIIKIQIHIQILFI